MILLKIRIRRKTFAHLAEVTRSLQQPDPKQKKQQKRNHLKIITPSIALLQSPSEE